MARSSCSSRPRSDGGGPAARRTAAGAGALLFLVACGAQAAPAGGEVRGSIAVEMAAVRASGAKDDLDVVLLLEPVSGKPAAPVAARAEMDQKGLVFLPHVLAVQRGTTVTFLNNDPEPHNVYFLDDRTGKTLDIGTYGPGVSVDHTFTEPGMVIVLCKLHLEMAAYVVVSGWPWFTAVRLDPGTSTASFRIAGVPPGEYELRAWHKSLKQKGGAVRVRVAGGSVVEVPVVITKARYARAAGSPGAGK